MSAPKWTLCSEIPKPQSVTRKLLRPDGSLLALVSSSATDAEAQMLGAAPDLFEALQACVGVLSGNDMSKSTLISALEQARLALTRARGEWVS